MLRQLMDADSVDAMFVLPHGGDPVLAGAAAADAHKSSIEALRTELTGLSSPAGLPPPSPWQPSDAAPADPLSARALKQLDSFDKWCGSQLEQTEGAAESPGDARALRPSDSLDRFWKSMAFEEGGVAPGAALPMEAGMPEQPSPGAMPHLEIPNTELDEALSMLEEPPAPYALPGGESLVRVSVKMFDRGPEDLGAPDLRPRLEEALAGASVAGAYLQVTPAPARNHCARWSQCAMRLLVAIQAGAGV